MLTAGVYRTRARLQDNYVTRPVDAWFIRASETEGAAKWRTSKKRECKNSYARAAYPMTHRYDIIISFLLFLFFFFASARKESCAGLYYNPRDPSRYSNAPGLLLRGILLLSLGISGPPGLSPGTIPPLRESVANGLSRALPSLPPKGEIRKTVPRSLALRFYGRRFNPFTEVLRGISGASILF